MSTLYYSRSGVMISTMSESWPYDRNTIHPEFAGSSDMPPQNQSDIPLNEAALRKHLFEWYINSGFRGCLFNKIAAKDAREGRYTWETPVEYGDIEEITEGEGGHRVLDTFEQIIGDGEKEGLVSYTFTGLKQPNDYVKLLRYLSSSNPERFRILPVVDREKRSNSSNDTNEYVGIPFRIKLGVTAEGEEAFAHPMIYTPDEFTTFARRYDYFMIAFNRFNSKQNPETPGSFIGVDDIHLDLSDTVFSALMKQSLAVNIAAHASDGKANSGEQFNRKLFRANNALVVPAKSWDIV